MGSGDFCLCSGMLRREDLNHTVNISNKALKCHGQSTIPGWKLPSPNTSEHFAGIGFLTCFKNLFPHFLGWQNLRGHSDITEKLHLVLCPRVRRKAGEAPHSQLKLPWRITHTYLLQVHGTERNEDPVSTNIPPKSTCLQVPRQWKHVSKLAACWHKRNRLSHYSSCQNLMLVPRPKSPSQAICKCQVQ